MSDTTCIYYTANHAPEQFLENVRTILSAAASDLPIISVSQKPLDFGENYCVGDIGRNHLNIYRQALIGAKYAKTKYIAMAEDDTLYSSEHLHHVPTDGRFAYNKNVWALYTWNPEIYSYKDRRNLNGLVCERGLFIEAMEERFARWSDPTKVDLSIWAEPGKYERMLDVTVRDTEVFITDIPNIAISHEQALSFENLGKRKKLGYLRAHDIPYWGQSENLIKTLYA